MVTNDGINIVVSNGFICRSNWLKGGEGLKMDEDRTGSISNKEIIRQLICFALKDR